jgi:cysteine desulfurase/selenocysteine lyase
MYSQLTEFRDGDNIVATMMEHNSNFVPWHALCREILPKFGRRVELRLAGFDPLTGELDLAHLASLVDERTKLVCCSGASNFLGTKVPLERVRAIAAGSGYRQPNGERRSLLLVDGAQQVASTAVDVQALDLDYLAFSCHKMLAPFGIGVLYAKRQLLEDSPPFLYGGDMIAEGQVFPDHVDYNVLPWKFAAGTPNIFGTIIAAEAMRLLVDLGLHPGSYESLPFRALDPLRVVTQAMGRIADYTRLLAERALEAIGTSRVTIYGPRTPSAGSHWWPSTWQASSTADLRVAHRRRRQSRAGCHCATLAHRHRPRAAGQLPTQLLPTTRSKRSSSPPMRWRGRRTAPI